MADPAAPSSAPAAGWTPPDADFTAPSASAAPWTPPDEDFKAPAVTDAAPGEGFSDWFLRTVANGVIAPMVGTAAYVTGHNPAQWESDVTIPNSAQGQQFSNEAVTPITNAISSAAAALQPPVPAQHYNAATEAAMKEVENTASPFSFVMAAPLPAGGTPETTGAPAPRAPSEAPSDAAVLATAERQAPPKEAASAAPAAPAAPSTPAPPVTHSADTDIGQHTFTSPNGVSIAQENGKYLQIKRSDTAPEAQGQGEDTARIAAANKVAQQQGLTLGSDVSVSPGHARSWQKYGEQSGTPIKENPNTVNPATGNQVSNDPRVPVYEAAPAPLPGAPSQVNIPGHGVVNVGPSAKVRDVAAGYAKDAGIAYKPLDSYVAVDPQKAATVASAYDAMPDTPKAPATAASYNAFKRETLAQYQAMQKAGVKVDFMAPGADPYAASPRLATEDVNNNNHLSIRPTGADMPADHPLAADSGVKISGQPASYNDLFHATHDYFGHAAEGNGFRGDGEYNAWRAHRALYSEAAQPALATETLGQNAWVNHGPYGEANRAANGASTVFAPQKAGLLPKSIWGADNPAGRQAVPSGASTVNIGLKVGENGAITPEAAAAALKSKGVNVLSSAVHSSATKPTLVARLSRALTPAEAHSVSAALRQESIAQYAGGRGELYGPGAEKRRPFNPDYFLTEEGTPLPKAPAGAVSENEPGMVPSKLGGAPPTTRPERAQVLRNLGVSEARESSLNADLKASSDDVQTSKLNNKAGNRMSGVLDAERKALRDRGDTLVERSGGTAGTDTSALHERGQTMVAPVEHAYDAIDARMSGMYKEAEAQARERGAVMGTTNVDKWIKDQEANGAFIRSTDAADFRQRIDSARKLFKMDKPGATAENAENFRKWIGAAYDPATADLGYGLKDSLDADVSAAGDPTLYQQARALRTFRADNFDNPKITKDLLAQKQTRTGLNRGGAEYEKVPDMIANAPVDQFHHLINTYTNIAKMFPELSGESAAAVKAVRAQFANRLRTAGDSTQGHWNAKAVSNEVAKNGVKMQRVFDPEGQQMIHELQQGGEIMRSDQSYKGAAVQASNLANMAAKVAKSGIGEVIGTHVGGLPGLIAGHVGNKGLEAISEGSLGRAVESRIADLSKEAAPVPAGGGASSVPRGNFPVAQRGPLSLKIPGQRGGPKYTPNKFSMRLTWSGAEGEGSSSEYTSDHRSRELAEVAARKMSKYLDSASKGRYKNFVSTITETPDMHPGLSDLQKILPHLTDQEKAQLRSDTSQRLVDHFFANPNMTRELAASALAGAPSEAAASLATRLAPHLKNVAHRVEAARVAKAGEAGPDVPF